MFSGARTAENFAATYLRTGMTLTQSDVAGSPW